MMEEKVIKLYDSRLKEVTGGSHLSSDEVKSLKPGQRLIVENNAKVEDVVYISRWYLDFSERA